MAKRSFPVRGGNEFIRAIAKDYSFGPGSEVCILIRGSFEDASDQQAILTIDDDVFVMSVSAGLYRAYKSGHVPAVERGAKKEIVANGSERIAESG
jgi:hypothetical protein